MENLFVYGFLKRGGPMEGFLRNEVFVGEDTVQGTLKKDYLFKLFPGNDTVRGELYRIHPELLSDLDRAEGHPTFYERQQVELGSGERAWTYFFKGAECTRALY